LYNILDKSKHIEGERGMSAYLFVHFKEKFTPDGEQVYFGLSKDGFNWEQVNNGEPVLTSHLGEEGVRDHTIIRKRDGGFVILATDLAIAKNFEKKYHKDWNCVNRQGSKCFSKWESDDLIHWSEQELVKIVDDDYGCAWAPDIIYDEENQDYMVHWSSRYPKDSDNFMAIFYAKTKDFKTYTAPQMLCKKCDTGIIDSNIVYENGYYYRFTKSDFNPAHIILERGTTLTGEYERMPAFDIEMNKLEDGQYEAPTCYKLPDGSWCLMLDFYGCEKEKQGYVPFVAKDISTGSFIRSDKEFSFPYGFKHGTVMSITDEEYDRINNFYSKN
jgi:hypothetical protein